MPLEKIPYEALQSVKREIILVYTVGGGGKTRFVTSLPERMGKSVYIPLDPGGESLDTVLPKYRPRLIVYKPDGKNPIVDAAAIATTNWKKLEPEANNIIIDTFSTLTWDLIQFITNKGMFSSKRVKIGEGTALETALPDQGEYGGTHAQIRMFFTELFKNNPTMNIIVTCHQDPPDNGAKGGPATVGKKMTQWLPGRFKTVIRLDTEVSNSVVGGSVIQSSKFVARSAPHGDWIARINEDSEKGNPMPYVALQIDPVHWWEQYLTLKGNTGENNVA